jgi:hypothetical protein
MNDIALRKSGVDDPTHTPGGTMKRTDKQQMEDRMERRAREIAKESGMPESLWELCLYDAYMESFRVSEQDEPKERDR